MLAIFETEYDQLKKGELGKTTLFSKTTAYIQKWKEQKGLHYNLRYGFVYCIFIAKLKIC